MNLTSGLQSRRQTLHATAAAGISAAIGGAIARGQPSQPAELKALLPAVKEIREKLHRQVHDWITAKRLARPDGYIYTIDVAQLLIYFAQAADAEGYGAMREHAEKNLIRDDRSDPYTKGFVPWRWKDGEKPDASGTTEALRLARGLWAGAKSFNRPADADLVLKILDGYSRHATVDQGVWLVRNYFGFNTRAFANNSFLIDYDPDFIREVADERKDAALGTLADNCLKCVQMAAAPSGLLYDIIQPEVSTLYPELNLTAFSPNDVISISNCCTTAISVANTAPAIARKVLAFAMNRLDDFRVYYLGRTGEPFNTTMATAYEYSILTRLAARLAADTQAATIADRGLNDWKWYADHSDTRGVAIATEVLLAMQALEAIKG